MRRNANVRAYKYWTVVNDSGIICQHVSSIVVFIAIFIHLYRGEISANNLITTGTILTCTGFVFWDLSIQKLDVLYYSKRTRPCAATRIHDTPY